MFGKKKEKEKESIPLGCEVEDTVSGLKGIAIAKTDWLYGCIRICIQPPAVDGKLPESVSFDEPQLKIISKGVLVDSKYEKALDKPGGPNIRNINQGKEVKR